MSNTSQPGAVADNDARVLIFDTTLRDGEQSPGASMTLEEKLEVADLLDQLGVDIIEAGFPIASPGDFESVSEVARRVKNASVAGLARASEKDIDRCAEALREAKRPRIHTFISTSPVHMKYKLQMEPERVLGDGRRVGDARAQSRRRRRMVGGGRHAHGDRFSLPLRGGRDQGRRDHDQYSRHGRLHRRRTEYEQLFRTVRERVPNSDKAIFSVHCHDDLGLAVANSLAGVRGGARQVECTINGIGERAGNAALEEIVMAMKTRADALPFFTNIDAKLLTRASKLVSAVTSFPVQYNKAIVGRNAFAHESGIHQDGMLKNAHTYEIMTPESVGVSKTSLVMGKHSGRHAFREKLKELGYDLGENALQDAFNRFKDLADRKKFVYDEDLVALVDDEIVNAHDHIKVEALMVMAGTHGPQSAALTLDIDGEKLTHQATGNGPVDAIFNAIKALAPHDATLELYQVHAVTEGTDAQAEVSVRLSENGKSVTGRGADPDTLVASARAYVSALNRLMAKRARGKPEAMQAI